MTYSIFDTDVELYRGPIPKDFNMKVQLTDGTAIYIFSFNCLPHYYISSRHHGRVKVVYRHAK